MKSGRLEKILEIISKYNIETQSELANHLKSEGFDTTQATVSRDIKRLKLIKVPSKHGSKYSVSSEKISDGMRFLNLISDSEAKFDYAGNLVVIKCLPGTAQALCAMLDKQSIPVSTVGTIAGDDTIFVAVKSEQDAKKFCEMYGK